MKILADIATCEDGRDKILSVYQSTTSPMGKTMFTLIGAMVELESSLISERVSAGMKAAKARGKHLGRPRTPTAVVARIETLAKTTNLSVREIQQEIRRRNWARGGRRHRQTCAP